MSTALVEIASTLIPRCELSTHQMEEMFQLLARHFDGVTREQFERDLAEKNWAILITRGECLVGFSTLLAYESFLDGEAFSVIYSGDTIMAREAWGTAALARAWIASVNQLRKNYPRGKYYWLLLTSGFRTYRFLPVFWRNFFPRCDALTPPDEKRLLVHLAQERFGKQFYRASGIVRFAEPQQLRGELADVPVGRITDPHIAFFLSQNPGHRDGDELVCLTELCPENLTAAGWRMVQPRPHESHGCHR